MEEASLLWFERVYRSLRLPGWAGVVVVGFLPMALLFPVGYSLAGLWSEMFSSGVLFILPLLFLVIVLAQLAAWYTKSVMLGLKTRADSMLDGGRTVSVAGLFDAKGVVAAYLVEVTAVQTVFLTLIISNDHTFFENMMTSLPFLYWNLHFATFFWVFGYSVYKIYQAGKLPMKLRSFTEDRTLGLRPFGRASLQLIAVYFAFLLMVLVAVSSFLGTPAGLVLLFVGLALLGLGLFFLPLVSLHGKLAEAKAEAMAWIAPQYTELVEEVRRVGVKNIDELTLSRLAGAESIRRDIGQIHGWPFDVGIVVRLSAIILSVTAILLAAVLREALGI